MSGFVWLVGAGPGASDLITVRGLNALRDADVVVHDRLVSPDLLSEAHAGALLIYAGKEPGAQAMTQEAINETLISHARRGRNVVRLKGGDPFVFGRGGEEAIALARAGISFEVVPGVTSATAAPASAGIPVSHRGVASSFAVVACHPSAHPPWDALARIDTVVILMGLERLGAICAALIDAGKPGATPGVVVQNATLPDQRSVRAPLWALADEARRAEIAAPAVVVIGEVAALSAGASGAEELAAELSQ